MINKLKAFLGNRLVWIALGLAVILFKSILSSEWIEMYYSRGLFLKIRAFLSTIGNAMEIPLSYLLIPGLIIWIVIKLWKLILLKRSWKHKMVQFLYSTLALVGGLVFFFQLLWGFNYSRISVESQLNLPIQKLNVDEIKSALDLQTTILVAQRAQLPSELMEGINESSDPSQFFNAQEITNSLERVLQLNDFPVSGSVQGKVIAPKGILLRFGTSGIYLPYTGQGHIDGGLHTLQIPFVLAHEMAHGYGFADEGTCNFWAYLTCLGSEDQFIKYAGELAYWRYLASSYRIAKPKAYREFRAHLPKALVDDLNSINKNLTRYPDLIPRLRNLTYNTYLKSQGIPEGMANYNKIVPMVEAWKKR